VIQTWSAVAGWLAAQADKVIETSCARVFLVGDEAWKIKRPVRLPFLDFSTRAKRRWALDRELAFNRRWASDIYNDVVAVRRASGSFSLTGEGETVEWLLRMRRFEQGAVLANQALAIDGDLGERLGRVIARLHAAAEEIADGGGAATLSYTIATNEAALSAIRGRPAAVRRLILATRAAQDAVADALDQRQADGFARCCHGDLHLGNILREEDRLVPFDCIEFNDRLSRIDVLYDVAFTIMDLATRERREAANRLLNAYLDEAARTFPPSLWTGLNLLPLFLSVRAAVRTHVTAATGDEAASARYLEAAESYLATTPPRLWAIGGLSGSGKTHLARALAPLVGDDIGAVFLRTDEIRKRLFGAAAAEPLAPSAYDQAADARVYESLFATAGAVIAAGRTVILDATFLAEKQRRGAAETARRFGVPFSPLWLTGEPDLLRARLAARGLDASDATASVLESQLALDLGELSWPRVPTGEASVRLAARLASG
jgi:hypothetical protein